VWQAADPVLSRYISGRGGNGVFNSANLALYSYGYLNPMMFLDPDGKLSKEAIAKLQAHEDSTDYMYRDTSGRVTVGVGHMISSESAAQKIKFTNGDKAATTEQISAGYKAVKDSKLPLNTRATKFEGLSELRVSDTVISDLFAGDIATAEAGAKHIFPDFDSLPESLQIGIVDMVFTTGTNGVENTFSNFTKAVKEKDWAKAAKESRRPQLSDERNAYVRGLFEDAAKSSIKDKAQKDAAKDQ